MPTNPFFFRKGGGNLNISVYFLYLTPPHSKNSLNSPVQQAGRLVGLIYADITIFLFDLKEKGSKYALLNEALCF